MKFKLLLLTVAAILVLPVASLSAETPEEEHQDSGTSDCVASWDPFCPRGTPTEEDDPAAGTGDADDCKICEQGYIEGMGNAWACVSTPAGSTGRTICETGWLKAYCDTSGAFCENITVTP